jgi:hypothetical protein
VGTTRSESPSLWTIVNDSIDEFYIASSEGGGGSSGFPTSQKFSVVTPLVPIMTMFWPEGTPTPSTIATVPLQTTIPRPGTGLQPERQLSEARTQEVNTRHRATQRRAKLTSEQAAIKA